MKLISMARQEPIKKIVELGKMGFYPLFNDDYLQGLTEQKFQLTKKDQERATSLLKRLTQHRTIERQKTVLFTMCEEDRNIVIRAIIKLVEGKILDETPQLH